MFVDDQGHERSITCVKYNDDGDLLFTAVGLITTHSLKFLFCRLYLTFRYGAQAKDTVPTLWMADTGERMGTYNGHLGAVWDLEPSWYRLSKLQ